MINGEKQHVDIDLSVQQLKKSVINILKVKLTDTGMDVLIKELSFTVSIDKIPPEEYIMATEPAACKLLQAEDDLLRTEIMNVLSKGHDPSIKIYDKI